MGKLIRFWFTFDDPVDRGTYFKHGALLAAVKYAVDALIIWAATRIVWTPLDYIGLGASTGASRLAGVATSDLMIFLALWTLPFFWIGLTMSMRRALDAGYSPWLALLFFVPGANYVFMGAMCGLPSRQNAARRASLGEHPGRFSRGLLAVGAGTATGIALIAISVLGMRSYGAALFFGTPFLIGAVSAYVFNRGYPATARETRGVVFLALLATAGALLAFAMEGLGCMIMALPLAFIVGWMGGGAGRFIAEVRTRSVGETFVAIALFPIIIPLTDARRVPMLHEVRSAVDIDAPTDVVWRNVVAFPRLPEPTELIFRSGISYPVGARIEGSGVGAVRYCEFSTGAFVEPIRRWEPGRRLSFDVTRNPPPMRELSPYGIAPPHLDGYFSARRGEFRLIDLGSGRTRLEGSTWYSLEIEPVAYWAPLADALVGRIHQRVLRHIKTNAESRAVN